MTKREREISAQITAEKIYQHLTTHGIASYQLSSGIQVIWFRWWNKAVDLANTKAISHSLLMCGQFEANVQLRKLIVAGVIALFRNSAISILHAPTKVQRAAYLVQTI
jgi:hypothetical protein